jgi:hypothetical protein
VRASANRRRYASLVLVLVGFCAVVWLVTSGGPAPTPYGPSSTAHNGAKALALLLGQLGVKVDTSGVLPAPQDGVALVLYDQLDTATRGQVAAWVRNGGSLVVADPSSPLTGAAVAPGGPDQPLSTTGPLVPGCREPWVKAVGLIDPAGDPFLEPPSQSRSCFRQGSDAFAVVTSEGAGVVVSLGGPDIWSNADLDRDDNALLAADLLAPARGGTVAWLVTSPVGGGTRTLGSLVPRRVKLCLLGLAIAAVVACMWRARRLGRPVIEEPLVPVPGSELVVATGRLLERNRRYEEAAGLMRDELCGQLCSRLGQAPGTAPATVARVVAARAGFSQDETVAALCGTPPHNEAELVELARSLQRMRRQVLHTDTRS